MTASNTLGRTLQLLVRAAITGADPKLFNGRKFTPVEVQRAINAARTTLFEEVGGDAAFELSTEHRT
jgi:hypothetical protein